MPVRLRCQCDAVLALHERYSGRKARCPECRWEFVVPFAQEGVDVVGTEQVKAYTARARAAKAPKPKPEQPEPQGSQQTPQLDIRTFQQMLGHEDLSDLPEIADDLSEPQEEVGPQDASELAPEKTATDIIVEQAFGTPQAEYDRLKSLLKADRDAPHLHCQLGDVCLSLGRRKEAISAYERAMELDKSYDYLENKIEELLGPQEYARRLAGEETGVEDTGDSELAVETPSFEDASILDGDSWDTETTAPTTTPSPTPPPTTTPSPTPAPTTTPSPTPPPFTKPSPTPAPTPPPPQARPTSGPAVFSAKDILTYPLRSGARVSIVVSSLLLSGMWYATNSLFSTGGPYLRVEGKAAQFQLAQFGGATILGLALCYIIAFHFKAILLSAEAPERSPEWPNLDRWWSEILRPLMCFLLHLLIGIVIPAQLLKYALPISGSTPDSQQEIIFALRKISLAALCFLYLPMAGLLVSKAPGVTALNPIRVVVGAVKAFRHYILSLLLFALSMGSAYLVVFAGAKLIISYPLDLPCWLLCFYFAMASSRALGRLYSANKSRLAWEPD